MKNSTNCSEKSPKIVNSLIGTKELLAHLDALKSVAQDFAAREQKMNAAFRDGSAKELGALDTMEQQHTVATSEQMAVETDAAAASKEQLERCFSRRKSRINRAYEAVQTRLHVDIKEKDDACKREAQQALIAAERIRDERRGQANAQFENFQNHLAQADAVFQQREKAVRRSFSGYRKFRRMLDQNPPAADSEISADNADLLAAFQRAGGRLDEGLARFRRLPAPQLFRFLPAWLIIAVLIGVALANPILHRYGNEAISQRDAIYALGAAVLVLAAYLIGGRFAFPLAGSVAAEFIKLRRLREYGFEQAARRHEFELGRIETEFEETKARINQDWKIATKELARLRSSSPLDSDVRQARLHQKNEQCLQGGVERLEQKHAKVMAHLRQEADARRRELADSRKTRIAKLEAGFADGWTQLSAEWQAITKPLFETLQALIADAGKYFPDWQTFGAGAWQSPEHFLNAILFARLEVQLDKFIGTLPKDKRLALPCPSSLSLPLLLTHPQQGSLLFETGKEGGEQALGSINNIILRLLATTPPGRVELTVFDPVGLGQNFASLMHLADYESNTINSRIWTQNAQFEEKLAELNEHMEKIIQMYLRNEYATITEYNAEAGSVAEKYQVLVVASFPANFSETAAKRLRNIAANGARCGVFTLIQWDHRNALPQDFVPDELRNNSVCLARTESGFEFPGWRAAGTRVVLHEPPSTELTTDLLRQIGKSGINANRVEVPFDQVAPAETEVWTGETTHELHVPIGRSGATKLQYLAIGRDTRQHALIAGKTGSGKSTLFHIIITNLALRCSPEQVEFYLVDFKKGVEFKCYGNHRLPHAKVVAIESDRAFGLSVLQRVDEELRRRGDLFRKAGAQDLAGYKRSFQAATASQPAGEPMPRVLLMIDEFQEFFVEEDRVAQSAAVLLDRIVRQGRAFGIHVILGSQTLGGAYTLARATIGQMVIRIALQCNEADAYLIMDQDNPAPRLLSRPGEGIYNDTAGSIEGNSPFQAVWLSDTTRENYLAKVRAYADKTSREYPGPIVFEGNAPADVRENHPLKAALKGAGEAALPPRIWLGAPNSIKGPTEAVFRHQSASNLLAVGQSDERMLTILSIGLISLAAQHPKGGAKFFVLHNLSAGFSHLEFFQRVIAVVPQPVVQAGNGNLAEVMGALSEELKRRSEEGASDQEIYLLAHDLQNFKKLRQEDEFNFSSSSPEATPAGTLLQLINEGPAHGIHVILTCDSYGNVTRFLGRKALAEIEMRVAFQMSAGDSASLIDAPDASTLGMHRAVLFNEREGSLEIFHPYALPGNNWIEEIARQLATR